MHVNLVFVHIIHVENVSSAIYLSFLAFISPCDYS